MVKRNLTISGFSDLRVFIQRESLHKSEHITDNRLHAHNEYELLINLKGDEHVIVEKKIYPITRGDIILSHPNERHHCVMKSEAQHEYFWILIDTRQKSAIAEYLDSMKANYYSPESEIRERVIQLCGILSEKDCGEVEAMRILLEILHLIKSSEVLEETTDSRLPKELSDVFDYIDAHISEELRINAIAHALGLSESTLTRRFKDFLGEKPMEYLKKKRMIKAAELLRDGASVLEAGIAVGYSDNSYFIKLFKSFYGVTPLKYKSEGN